MLVLPGLTSMLICAETAELAGAFGVHSTQSRNAWFLFQLSPQPLLEQNAPEMKGVGSLFDFCFSIPGSFPVPASLPVVAHDSPLHMNSLRT